MKAPLFPIAIVFLSGILTASWINMASCIFVVLIFSLAVIVLYFVFSGKKALAHTFVFLLVFLAGMARFLSFNDIPRGHIRSAVTDSPRDMRIRGEIVTNPVFKRKFGFSPELEFLLKVDALAGSSVRRGSSGLLLVNAYFKGDQIFKYGDRVVIEGKVAQPRGGGPARGFDYKKFLAGKRVWCIARIGKDDLIEKIPSQRSVYVNLRRYLYSLKNKARDNALINLTPPYSGIFAAMLLGERQLLDEPTKQIFIRTGTMHVLAISGLHVGIIALILLALLRICGIPEKPAYLFTVILILSYALAVGERASVWRAAIMASCFLIGFIVDRRSGILNLLSMSLVLLLFLNPNYIYDIGFILSFACIASIIWISPLTDRLFGVKRKDAARVLLPKRPRIWIYGLKSLSVSSSIWFGIFPVIAYNFHVITPVTILANLVVIPICFCIISAGVGTFILSVIPLIAMFLYEAVWVFCAVMLYTLECFSKIPGAYIEIGHFHVLYVLIYYGILISAVKYFSSKNKREA